MELVYIFTGMGMISTALSGMAWHKKNDKFVNDAMRTAVGFYVLALVGMLFV